MNRRLFIKFADNGNIRKWSREPFEGGQLYVPAEFVSAEDWMPVASVGH